MKINCNKKTDMHDFYDAHTFAATFKITVPVYFATLLTILKSCIYIVILHPITRGDSEITGLTI